MSAPLGSIRSIAALILAPYAPTLLKVEKEELDYIYITVVSNAFAKVPMLDRIEELNKLFDLRAPQFQAEYKLIFGAWTIEEFSQLTT